MNFLDDLIREHGSGVEQQLTSQLGPSPEQASAVLPKVGPLILGGLKRQMETHGPEHVENLAGNFSEADLGSLLGGKHGEANNHLAQHLGISGSAAAKIIPMLAPIILGALLKRGGSTPPAGGSGGLGGLGRILDRDGDGQILDDLAGIFTGGGNSSPGGGMGGLAQKAGCLSSILGGLLKGRR